jgi:hypothetical protein
MVTIATREVVCGDRILAPAPMNGTFSEEHSNFYKTHCTNLRNDVLGSKSRFQPTFSVYWNLLAFEDRGTCTAQQDPGLERRLQTKINKKTTATVSSEFVS